MKGLISIQDVPVISAFEMMAEAIRIFRPFDYKHGGVVMSHDVLGERTGKKHHKSFRSYEVTIVFTRETVYQSWRGRGNNHHFKLLLL